MSEKRIWTLFITFFTGNQRFFPASVKTNIVYTNIMLYGCDTFEQTFALLFVVWLNQLNVLFCYLPIHFWCSINLLLEKFRWNGKIGVIEFDRPDTFNIMKCLLIVCDNNIKLWYMIYIFPMYHQHFYVNKFCIALKCKLR